MYFLRICFFYKYPLELYFYPIFKDHYTLFYFLIYLIWSYWIVILALWSPILLIILQCRPFNFNGLVINLVFRYLIFRDCILVAIFFLTFLEVVWEEFSLISFHFTIFNLWFILKPFEAFCPFAILFEFILISNEYSTFTSKAYLFLLSGEFRQ